MAENPHQKATLQAGIAGWISHTEYRLADGTVVIPVPVGPPGQPQLDPTHGTPLYVLPDNTLIHHGFGVPEVPPEQRPPDLTKRSEYREYMLGAASIEEWDARVAHVRDAHGGRLPMFFAIDCTFPPHLLMPVAAP